MTVSYPRDMRKKAKELDLTRLVTLDVSGIDGGGMTFQGPATEEESKWWADRYVEFVKRFRTK